MSELSRAEDFVNNSYEILITLNKFGSILPLLESMGVLFMPYKVVTLHQIHSKDMSKKLEEKLRDNSILSLFIHSSYDIKNLKKIVRNLKSCDNYKLPNGKTIDIYY